MVSTPNGECVLILRKFLQFDDPNLRIEGSTETGMSFLCATMNKDNTNTKDAIDTKESTNNKNLFAQLKIGSTFNN